MKQVLQDLRTGDLLVDDVPVPEPGPGQVLVRVGASLVSTGTERMVLEFAQRSLVGKAKSRPDLVRRALAKARVEGPLAAWKAASARLDQPMPLGYSCAGRVVGCGPSVADLKTGDRVACAGAGWANHAEYVAVPELLCAPLGAQDSLSDAEAAFCTVGAVALQGLRLSRAAVGESVAVIGLGLVGQLCVQLSRSAGCRVFAMDVDPARVALAARLGADVAVARDGAEEAAAAFTDRLGFDAVLIAAESKSPDPVNLAAELARDRGCVVSVGAVALDVPRDPFYRKELTLKVSRSYGPGRYDPVYEAGGIDYPFGHVRWTEGRNLREVARQLSAGLLRVEPLITHRVPVAEAPRAYAVISGAAQEPFLGVILTYPSPEEPRRAVPTPDAPSGTTKGKGVGVIGAGLFATTTALPALKGLRASLRGVASASGASARAAARRFGFAFSASSAAEILADEGTGLAAILTRHDLHAPQVLAALAAGKSVFVEKPLCLDPDDLERIAAAARAGGLPVTVGFNRRFAPLTLRLLGTLSSVPGPKALLVRVAAGELPAGHWLLDPAVGGGRLLGEGCHFIDWACFVTGSAPTAVKCVGFGRRPGEQDWALTIRFADGSLADILYTALGDASAGKERYEVHAAGFSASLDDFRRLEMRRAGKAVRAGHWMSADKGHAGLWRAVLARMESASSDPIPLESAIRSMRVTFAAMTSLRDGSKEVPI